jgi:flagellar protein FliS
MVQALALNRYRTVQVTTSTPGERLLLVYDGLFRFLGEGATALEAKDRARGCERIERSHALLAELAGSLDSKHAPELCDNLEAIYLFCMGRLVRANLEQDAQLVREVIRVLTPLREAWVTAVRAVAAAGDTP